jgi:flagellar basal-body rod protein FlgB
MARFISETEKTFRDRYRTATRSNQENFFEQSLLACALAKTDDAFDESRKVLVSRTNLRHLPDHADQNIEYEAKITGDKVKLDVEMANLAENQLMYNTTIEMLVRKFRGLETVLKEAK